MSELESLPPDVRALFADERETYEEDLAARARVMRRIEASIAFGAVGVAATTAVAAKTGLLASLSLHAAKHVKLWIALSLATGAVVGETHARLSAAPPPAVSRGPDAPTAAVSAAPAATSAPSELNAIPVSSLPTIAPSPAAPIAQPPSSLAAEQSLIDTARSALARGRAADALRVTDDHARQFPRGRLAEERETLAIQALLLAGRRPEAESRGQRFHKTYPASLYGNAVDALLALREDAGR